MAAGKLLEEEMMGQTLLILRESRKWPSQVVPTSHFTSTVYGHRLLTCF